MYSPMYGQKPHKCDHFQDLLSHKTIFYVHYVQLHVALH